MVCHEAYGKLLVRKRADWRCIQRRQPLVDSSGCRTSWRRGVFAAHESVHRSDYRQEERCGWHSGFWGVKTWSDVLCRQDGFYSAVVGIWRDDYADYTPQTFWQDVESEHAELLFFRVLWKSCGFIWGVEGLGREKLSQAARAFPRYISVICRC